MKTYYVKCETNTENINLKIFKTKNNKSIMQSQCTNCKNKKSGFVRKTRCKGFIK